MPKEYTCSFCGDKFTPDKGLMYVARDGSVYFFCSHKCKENMLKLKRDPRKLKWTLKYKKQRP